MKLMMLLLLSMSSVMAFAQSDVESENVDGLTLEAPEETLPGRSEETDAELLRGAASEKNYDEEQQNEQTAKQIMESSEAENPAEAPSVEAPQKKQPQATTEDILKQKGMAIKPPKDSKPAGHKQMVELHQVSGVQKYKITCALNDDIREITAIVQDDGSIGIVHKKFGVEKTAVITKDPAYADQIADKIYNNLANNKYPYACTRD